MSQAFIQRRLSFPLHGLMKACVSPSPQVMAQSVMSESSHGGFSTAPFEDALKRVIGLMGQSPIGAALLRSAGTYGLSVGLDPLLEPNASFHYARQNHFDLGYQDDLLQGTEKGLGRYLLSFTSALRRGWHHHRGFYLDPAHEAPENFLDHHRIMEADISAVTHLAAWELRAQGFGFLWRQLSNGVDGDIALVFEQSLRSQPQDQFNGRALKAAFNQWFAERARGQLCDRRALELIDMALLMRHAAALPVHAPTFRREGLQHLGLLPSGRNYLAGCLFTSAWYGGLDDQDARDHLAALKHDMSQALAK